VTALGSDDKPLGGIIRVTTRREKDEVTPMSMKNALQETIISSQIVYRQALELAMFVCRINGGAVVRW
jgi:hypothetical protein